VIVSGKIKNVKVVVVLDAIIFKNLANKEIMRWLYSLIETHKFLNLKYKVKLILKVATAKNLIVQKNTVNAIKLD
jgi:hypothetical protein